MFLFTLNINIHIHAQDVYKTPSGNKYHLSSCRMVENVSKKLVGNDEVSEYKLTPCKICNPPRQLNLSHNYTSSNKAVGTSSSVRCNGYTLSGTSCKHKTRLANGYCYQHTKQNRRKSSTRSTASRCGARTKSGGSCKRMVKGGGRCYQH